MATRHKLGSSSPVLALSQPALGRARPGSGRLAHLSGMETTNAQRDVIEQILSTCCWTPPTTTRCLPSVPP